MIALLHLPAIESPKWGLYSKDLRPQHAVTEVHVENGEMVVDPLFGLWFSRPDGDGYYGVKDLKDHPEILKD